MPLFSKPASRLARKYIVRLSIIGLPLDDSMRAAMGEGWQDVLTIGLVTTRIVVARGEQQAWVLAQKSARDELLEGLWGPALSLEQQPLWRIEEMQSVVRWARVEASARGFVAYPEERKTVN